MSTEQETHKDLPLEADAAEEVVGGRSVKRHSKTRVYGHPTTEPMPSVGSTPPGLGMGPDPSYPNPDIDTGDPNA